MRCVEYSNEKERKQSWRKIQGQAVLRQKYPIVGSAKLPQNTDWNHSRLRRFIKLNYNIIVSIRCSRIYFIHRNNSLTIIEKKLANMKHIILNTEPPHQYVKVLLSYSNCKLLRPETFNRIHYCGFYTLVAYSYNWNNNRQQSGNGQREPTDFNSIIEVLQPLIHYTMLCARADYLIFSLNLWIVSLIGSSNWKTYYNLILIPPFTTNPSTGA